MQIRFLPPLLFTNKSLLFMESEIIAVILAAGLTAAGFLIKSVYAPKSLVYAKHNEMELIFIKKFAEIKDIIEQSFTATNEKFNTITTADQVCRANLGGITKERIQDLETHQGHNEEAIKTMQETTAKLGKDISSIQTGLNKLEKDMVKLETGLKALQEMQNNMMALLNKIHGETAAKTNVLKKAISGTKSKGVISKETYKGKL